MHLKSRILRRNIWILICAFLALAAKPGQAQVTLYRDAYGLPSVSA
jgi:hypothetical protein